ncbi:endonuclease domain-containing protein [Bacillota bacterium Meth-B3]
MRNRKAFMSLPYNPELAGLARELRKAGNLAEVLFWRQVHRGRFKGYDFDRQKIIGNYIADFFCANCGVVIEIDGHSHDERTEHDAERDAFFEGLGLAVIRIAARDILGNLEGVMIMLRDHPALRGSPPRLRAPLQGGE